MSAQNFKAKAGISVSGYGQIINSSGQWVGPNSGLVGYTGSKGDAGAQGAAGYTGSQGYVGSSGALNAWSVKTTNYTSVNGDRIIANTSGGQFTVTLPAAPSTGDYIQITDGASFEIVSLVISRNGSTIEGIADNMLLDIANATYEFIYDGSTWQATATVGPIGYTGSQGLQGAVGYTGSAGYAGSSGTQGVIGYTGSQGSTGAIGYTGSQGTTADVDLHLNTNTAATNEVLSWTGVDYDWITVTTNTDIHVNNKTITEDYTLTSIQNGMSTGPLIIDSTITVESGARWVVI